MKNTLWLEVSLALISVGLWGCEFEEDPDMGLATATPTFRDYDPVEHADLRCPIREMAYIEGSGGTFVWGADPQSPPLGALYNWILEHEYQKVEPFCMLIAPFPGRWGYPYFDPEDQDENHGFSYGDIDRVVNSPVLANIELSLITFRQMAWFQKNIEGDVDLNFCDEDIRPDGMLDHEECRTSLGVEIGPYSLWTIYDEDARQAHVNSIMTFSDDEFVGYPQGALDYFVIGWGGEEDVCPERTYFCPHQHVVEYRALHDGPFDLGLDLDPDNPYQTYPGYAWPNDLVMLVTEPAEPDEDRQLAYDQLVRAYSESGYDKTVLWSSQMTVSGTTF